MNFMKLNILIKNLIKIYKYKKTFFKKFNKKGLLIKFIK